METFGVLLKLEEHLVALAQDHPFFAGLIVFVIIVLAANIAVTQIKEVKKLLSSEWIRKPVVLVSFAVAFAAAIAASIIIVNSLRKSTEALPKIVEESSVVIGQPLRLQWTYDYPSRFEIQSAKNATFSQDWKKEGYRNGTLILLEHVNDDRYWRVRAVDANNQSASGWSSPVRIAHYDSSLTRLKNTGSV